MTSFYEDGQVGKIFPYCQQRIDWFIIGGPADANEAQVFVKSYPGCRAVGFEPNKVQYQFQLNNGFPGELHNVALWSSVGEVNFTVLDNNHRCGSIVHFTENDSTKSVKATTLDEWCRVKQLEGHSVERVVLWIDIEGSEIECLKGAHNLLMRGAIKLLNIEVSSMTKQQVVEHLRTYGYAPRHEWNPRNMPEGHIISDIIFAR